MNPHDIKAWMHQKEIDLVIRYISNKPDSKTH